MLNSGNHAKADWESWVRGELTLDHDFNWIAASFPASDSTNVLYLNRSPLAPYGTAPGLWRCPSDQSTRTIGGQRYPRTRPPLVKDLRLPTVDPVNGFPSPLNPDVRWLQERTFQRGD